MNLGILSTASINDMVLQGAERTGGVDVVAVASREHQRAVAYARKYDIPKSFGSYAGLLSDADIDGVYISLPNSLHVEWTIRALEAGKHVLCEKPLSANPEEVKKVIEVASRYKLVVMEGFMYRHHPQTIQLLEMVRQEAIGRLRYIRAYLGYSVADASDIRLGLALGGGSLMDLGCYCAHVSRLLGGEPRHVYAEQVVGSTGVDVVFAAVMRLADDVIAQFAASLIAPTEQALEVVGESGCIRVRAPFRVDFGVPRIELARAGHVEYVEVDPLDSYALELEQFAKSSQSTSAAPVSEATDLLGQARTLAALSRSARRGLRVHL